MFEITLFDVMRSAWEFCVGLASLVWNGLLRGNPWLIAALGAAIVLGLLARKR